MFDGSDDGGETDETERQPPTPGCQYQLSLQPTAQSSTFSTVGLMVEGQKHKPLKPRMFLRSRDPPIPRFSPPGLHQHLEETAELKNPSKEGFSTAHTGYCGPPAGNTDFTAIDMGGWCQDMTTGLSLESEWLLPSLHWVSGPRF